MAKVFDFIGTVLLIVAICFFLPTVVSWIAAVALWVLQAFVICFAICLIVGAIGTILDAVFGFKKTEGDKTWAF